MLKTDFVDVLTVISDKLYASAAQVIDTASRMIPANTFCIANLDRLTTKVVKAYNRGKVMLGEGLVVENRESYCALVTEHAQGPLIIDNNLTHPLTKDMDATEFVGGCSFLGVPILDPEGGIYGSLCAFDDHYYRYQDRDVELLVSLSRLFTTLMELEAAIEGRKEAESQAAKMLEEKANLLAVLSHEIRTPMNGVLGFVGLLQSTELSQEQASYADMIAKSGTRLIKMVDHILEYSKLESGTMKLDNTLFMVQDIAKHALQMIELEARRRNLSLVSRFELEENEIVMGDSSKITQVLLNLLGNATKFTDEGEVGLYAKSARTADGQVAVSFEVWDTGRGIAEDKRNSLFHSFSQAHDKASASLEYGGVGLGLSICKQLAGLMGGDVTLISSTKDGSRFGFSLVLPRCETRDQQHA